jgi:hypothetical protein
MTPKPKIVPLKAIPAWRNGSGNWAFANSGYTAEQNGINGDIIRDSLSPAIDVIAASRATQVALVVDLHTPFLTLQSLVPDFVHPNRVGQDSLARKLHRALLPIVTSIAPRASSGHQGGAASRPVRRIHIAGGKIPDWMHGTRILSLDGKTARVGADGTLPAGVYFVRPKRELRSEK